MARLFVSSSGPGRTLISGALTCGVASSGGVALVGGVDLWYHMALLCYPVPHFRTALFSCAALLSYPASTIYAASRSHETFINTCHFFPGRLLFKTTLPFFSPFFTSSLFFLAELPSHTASLSLAASLLHVALLNHAASCSKRRPCCQQRLSGMQRRFLTRRRCR